jgi:predicted TIM-barrel fold metal-dependent hydrolase
MRDSRPLALALVLSAAAPVAAQGPGGGGARATIQAGEECPPGMTEVRPRNCQAPTLPPPSIVDYRPRNTLKVPAHPVPRARFPAIDYHGHPTGQLASAEGLEELGRTLDAIGVRVMVVANNVRGAELERTMALVRASPTMKDRVRVLTGIDFSGVGSPGWAQRAVADLEANVARGAVGVGEVGKQLGLSTRKADGTRLRIDDPELDPVWEACARLRLPVFIHTADPQEFWQPIDAKNERWLELALFPNRRYGPEFPPFEQLMTERDNLLKRHPRTTFVIAHMGWHTNDLARLGALMDAHPNVHTEVGAVLYDIGRQPRAARDFFVKYQDRILFGKDSFQPEEYPYYWRVFETRDDYFDYYRDYHAFWKLYGIDLPDAVLRKVYYQNALRITPGIPATGFPRGP